MEKLAIEGGEKVRDTYLSYGRQYIDEADKNAVLGVLESDFLTCGPKVAELERKLCSITGAKHATAVSNGTAALHVACLAAGIGEGDEVITVPITFAASANCVLYHGGVPVFADIDADTWTISPKSIEQKITDKTKAVIAVDFTGQACNFDEILKICKQHNLILIEDAAHSIGTLYDGKPVGSIADLTTFSFHPVKTVTAGEGGAVLTNDDALAQKVNLFSKHGITREKDLMSDAAADASNWYYEQVLLGYNYRLTDIQSALCVSQLDKLPLFSKRRKELTAFYNEAFSKIDGIVLQRQEPKSDTTRHLYILRFDKEKFGADRKEIYDALQAENIGVNVHYIPIYHFPYYQSLGAAQDCPNAEALYQEMLTIPLHYGMTDADARDVVHAVSKVCARYHR